MTKQTKQAGSLLLLLGVFGVVLKYQLSAPVTTGGGGGAPASNPRQAAAVTTNPVTVTDVRLERLHTTAGSFAAPQRDPFRYRPKPAPPPPVAAAPPPAARPPQRPVVPTAAPARPIPMKYIGFITLPSGTLVAGLLLDGNAHTTLSGKQGDVIDGQYRLLRVEPGYVEMAYLDGSGSRRITKTGQ